MAFTHRAARAAGSQTIAHCLHAYKYKLGVWAIVEEFPQIPLDTLRQMARWYLVGWMFICMGDPDGQLPPIRRQMGGDAQIEKLRQNDGMMTLSHHLFVELSIYRKGTDPELYAHDTGLPTSSDETLCIEVERSIKKYPYKFGKDLHDARFMSDAKRATWNKGMNRHLANCRKIHPTRGEVTLIECENDEDGNPKYLRGSTSKQYDMILWEGWI